MSACWKVSWEEYLVMSSGISEPEYNLHCFNVKDGSVVFQTKREQKVLEDVIYWANDGVIPERAPSTGEPTKKVKKSKDTDGPSIGSTILQNPNKHVTRVKRGTYVLMGWLKSNQKRMDLRKK